MKRAAALFMAAVLCMGLTVPAFAAEKKVVAKAGMTVTIGSVVKEERETLMLLDHIGDEEIITVNVYDVPAEGTTLVFDLDSIVSCCAYERNSKGVYVYKGVTELVPYIMWDEYTVDWSKAADESDDMLFQLGYMGKGIAPDECVYLRYEKEEEPAPPVVDDPSLNPFVDVSENDYYYNAVMWALKNKITTGVTPTRFQPAATCTRGQVATFLWRAKGSPEPATTVNPFTDVAETSPFYKAILWAYETGITTGATETTFNPAGICSGAHVVTFLWRAEGKPAAAGDNALAAANPGQYFTDAVAWADGAGLLSGLSFDPAADSPRADIVTYLYRNMTR